MCTAKNARKLPALRKNPAVALTIDTEVHPPKILLIRGVAELDEVDGIPDEYLQASGTYKMTAEQRQARRSTSLAVRRHGQGRGHADVARPSTNTCRPRSTGAAARAAATG